MYRTSKTTAAMKSPNGSTINIGWTGCPRNFALLSIAAPFAMLQGFQKLDEVALLLRRETQLEMTIVVIDHGGEVSETPVVVEAAFGPCKEAAQRRRAVFTVGRTHRLKIIDADLFRRVKVPTRLCIEGRDVARAAAGRRPEHLRASFGGFRI